MVTAKKRRSKQNEARASQREYPLPPIREVSDEEARVMFDRLARHYLSLSGDEFLRRWDAGEYAEDWDDRPEVRRLVMMIPFGR